MKHVNCPQEAAVTKAVCAGSLETSLTIHAATCAVCREIIQASSWMQALARSSESSPRLPDASLLWWNAQLSERRAKVEKAQNVFEWVELTSVAAISLALAVCLAWNWSAIQGSMAWISANALLWAAAYPMPTLFLPILAAMCLAALALAYPILVDE